MSALVGAAVLAFAAWFVLAGAAGQLPTLGSSDTVASVPAGGSTAPLDPRIAALAPGSALEAIVQFNPGVSVARAQSDALGAGGHVAGTLHIINALAVKMTAGQARTLAGNGDVHSVTLNTQVASEGGPTLGTTRFNGAGQAQNTYDQTLDATGLWGFGATGAGVGVAVIDTGIDGNLRDFRSASGGSRVVETAVTNPAATTATDGYGHGTDVAGIIAGDRAGYVGVAPDANLISIKASDDSGKATVLDVIYGLQFAVDHQSDFNIRVVNLSLDSATPQSYKTDPLDAAVESAWMHGLVVVAAAGNRGDASDAVQYAPANDPYVITVGGVDENGSANPANDEIASWSSRGVTQDGLQKPDVYAPGAHIVSVLAPGSAFASECGDCIVDGHYIRTSGTSMAAPMISGLIADVLSRHPSLSPDQIKGAITSSFVRSSATVDEVNGLKLLANWRPQPADQGLTPSSLISDANGNIDYSMSSWSMSSWSLAKGALKAGFAMSSWSCASCTGDSGAADPSMSSWSMSSWSTTEDR